MPIVASVSETESLQLKLKEVVRKGQKQLLLDQHADGYWSYPVEVDVTLTCEYLLLRHFLGIWDSESAVQASRYLWAQQGEDGGWPLFYGGESNISASVKAYFALKLSGFSTDEPNMIRAQQKILSLGGIEACNVFTQYQLALFGQFPWQGAPAMPLEVFSLPDRSYFSMANISYWSRAVLIPLLVILHFKPSSVLSDSMQLDELYLDITHKKKYSIPFSKNVVSWKNVFLLIDKALHAFEKISWKPWRKSILKKIKHWLVTHVEIKGGLGAIFPAMANSVIALKLLGYSLDHPLVQRQWNEIEELICRRSEQEDLFVQPCHSPIWDTALAILTLIDLGLPTDSPQLQKAGEWLLQKQVTLDGDWKKKHPEIEGKGWFFQFENSFYPDVDDSAIVIVALSKIKFSSEREKKKQEAIESGRKWLEGMQSSDGGWGAFDKDNNHIKLNLIPFADHGALLDPSTADVTARALLALRSTSSQLSGAGIERGLKFLAQEQELNGSWYGRWGANYHYGTWSVLTVLREHGFDSSHASLKRANDWLHLTQNKDGGWGESLLSYESDRFHGKGESAPSQTGWALMALLASGENRDSRVVQKGVQFLVERQNEAGGWEEKQFTGTGFPRVFYLKYHGYPLFFPLMALGQITRPVRPAL